MAVVLAAVACGGSARSYGSNAGGTGGGQPTGGSAGQAGGLPDDCTGSELAMPKRLIRLSFNQLANTLRGGVGDAFADQMITEHEIATPGKRAVPPLADISEGSSYIDTRWQTADDIANAAGQHVHDNFATFTECGAAPTTECARAFVLSQAERAYRRPLTEREKNRLLQVYDEALAAPGATIQEAVQYSVYAIYSAPQFLYRTEFGTDAGEGPLTPYEIASQLAYFLSDGPPDQALLEAAAQNALSTPEQIAAHVDRLLALPAAKINLEGAIFTWIGVSNVLSVVVDPTKVPATEFNAGVANSMYHEAELFLRNLLWSASPVSDLVTSQRSFINANLANVYDLPVPTAGLDADGFGPVDLPANRAGLLTMPGFLTPRSRPDGPSVIARGLAVNGALLCQDNPPFPEGMAAVLEGLRVPQMGLTEREKAEYRASVEPCAACHAGFDPYGLALENFDMIGRFRTVDDEDRPIDASVTLPATVGGGVAMNAVELANAMVASGAFSACVATKLMTYALAEGGVSGNGNSCATKIVAQAFADTDQTFSALVKAVAVSKTLTHRSGGAP